MGSTVDPATGELYAVRTGLADEFRGSRPPIGSRGCRLARGSEPRATPPLATTLAVVATDATLTKAQCAKVSGIGHDGMARAIRPVHTMFDGDTVFTLATGAQAAPDLMGFHALLDAAGDCVSRAIGHAMLAAETTADLDGCGQELPRRLPFGAALRASADSACCLRASVTAVDRWCPAAPGQQEDLAPDGSLGQLAHHDARVRRTRAPDRGGARTHRWCGRVRAG